MDLLTAAVTVVGPTIGKILSDVWSDYRTGRQMRLGVAVDSQGDQKRLPMVNGYLSVPDSDFIEPAADENPIYMNGCFFADEDFADLADILLEDEEKWVVMLVADEDTQDAYFFEFSFDRYAISLWPGNYSFYAFIVDPLLDEVMAFGYPASDAMDDPNPIVLSGQGGLSLDFVLFDIDELP